MTLQTRRHCETITATRPPMHTQTIAKKTARRSITLRALPSETESALRPSQLVNVATQELEWFFTSDETAGPAQQARALIGGWLSTLDAANQRALALRFDTTPWPEALQAKGLEGGYAMVLSQLSTRPWRPESRPHHEPDRRASQHLESAVRKRSLTVLRWISRRAEWDFASAVRAYARVRGLSPSVLPHRAA